MESNVRIKKIGLSKFIIQNHSLKFLFLTAFLSVKKLITPKFFKTTNLNSFLQYFYQLKNS